MISKKLQTRFLEFATLEAIADHCPNEREAAIAMLETVAEWLRHRWGDPRWENHLSESLVDAVALILQEADPGCAGVDQMSGRKNRLWIEARHP